MKNTLLKKTVIVTIIILLIAVFIPKSFAFSPGEITGEVSDDSEINTEFVEKIVNMLRVLGTFIAIGVMMVIGIKYMTGSIEEKANYKKTMMPYLVGCLLLFGASTIAPQILEMFKETTDTEAVGNKVLGLIQVIGSFVTVGVLMILGIKYILGSTEERAGYKKSLLPYVIGCVLLFAAVNLTAFIYDAIGLDEESFDSSSAISDAHEYMSTHSVADIREELAKAQARLLELNGDENANEEEVKYYRTYSVSLSEYLKWQN